jgi:Domain of Unknown Function (DUF748)
VGYARLIINTENPKFSNRSFFLRFYIFWMELKFYYDILKMKIVNANFKKPLITVISSIIVIVIAVILLASPITKYLIEKNDIKYIGREIKMGRVYVNLFTGYVHIRNLKIYESKSQVDTVGIDSVFFSAKGISANFALLKLFSKTIEIKNLTLDHPMGIIIQNKKDFNFNDLVKKIAAEKTEATTSPFHFNILNIKIKNGEFHYREKVIPINYFIREVNIESTGKYWNADTIRADISFLSGIDSGSLRGSFTINLKNLDYRLAAVVHKYDLNFLDQYLKNLVNYGTFSANLDADIIAAGNFNDQEDLNARGVLAINNFHFGIKTKDDYASFDRLVLKIDELSPRNHKYLFDSLSLNHPFIKFELYDYLDNVQKMFGKYAANTSGNKTEPARFNLIFIIGNYIKVLAKNFFQSDYKINRLAIYKGCFRFNDYSSNEKFSIETNPLYIVADSVNKNSNWVKVSLKSGIKPYGNITAALSINPKDSGDFDMQYHLQRLPVSIFNPYLITYTSFPLDRGTIEITGTWKVRHGIIKSDNHFLVIDPHVLRQQSYKNTKLISSPLIMFLTRQHGNVIDYQIPITGNMKNPTFHLRQVVFHIFGKIFVNPALIPFRLLEKKPESEVDKSLILEWEMRQYSLLSHQEKFVNKMADFLKKNPDATLAVYPSQYAEKEKEYISFFEARKKYFLISRRINALFLSKDDSLKVEKMRVKDSLFVNFLNKHVHDSMLFTVQEKCRSFVGSAAINNKFEQLNKKREDAFLFHFKKEGVENRVKIINGENNIPYNGFSFYKIVYKGELPRSLIKAYKQMN